MSDKCPNPDKRNLGGWGLSGLRSTWPCVVLLLLHVMITPWFSSSFAEPALSGTERAVGQGQRSQRVSGAAAQHGPADPGTNSTWSREQTPWLRWNCVVESLSVSSLLLLCVVRKFLFTFLCSVSSNTYKHTYGPTWNIPVLEMVTYANKPEKKPGFPSGLYLPHKGPNSALPYI